MRPNAELLVKAAEGDVVEFIGQIARRVSQLEIPTNYAGIRASRIRGDPDEGAFRHERTVFIAESQESVENSEKSRRVEPPEARRRGGAPGASIATSMSVLVKGNRSEVPPCTGVCR